MVYVWLRTQIPGYLQMTIWLRLALEFKPESEKHSIHPCMQHTNFCFYFDIEHNLFLFISIIILEPNNYIFSKVLRIYLQPSLVFLFFQSLVLASANHACLVRWWVYHHICLKFASTSPNWIKDKNSWKIWNLDKFVKINYSWIDCFACFYCIVAEWKHEFVWKFSSKILNIRLWLECPVLRAKF